MSKRKKSAIGALIFLVLVGVRFFSVVRAHHAFRWDVRDAVYDNWESDNAPQVIENIIRQKAQGRGIKLNSDAVKIEYQKTLSNEVKWPDRVWEYYDISVEAMVTYHRTIIPFVPQVEFRASGNNKLRFRRE